MFSKTDTRAPTLLAYAACLAVVVALLPLESPRDVDELLIALALQVLVATALILGDRAARRRSAAVIGIALFLASVALLRDSTGAMGGYGPLVLLPVIWTAVRGRVRELAYAIVGAGLVYFLPLVLVGAPRYPISTARAGALLLVISGALGLAVMRLVRALRAQGAQSTAVLAAMSEGLALTRDGAIVAVNDALCRITGFTEAQLLGARPPFPFWPPELHDATEDLRRQVVAANGGDFELVLMRADGQRFPASITAAPADLPEGGLAFLNTVRDITERRAHEDAIRRRADALAAIAAVTRAVSHSTAEDARRTICEVAVEVTGASGAALWEGSPEGVLRNTCVVGARQVAVTIDAGQARNGTWLAWQTGRPLFVADAAASPHVDDRILGRLAREPGGASLHYRPIRDAEAARGVLVLFWAPAIAELRDDLEPVLDVLAFEAAAAMQRADLLSRLEELSRTDELTGLPNRRAWEEMLDREVRVARRTGQPLALAMVDLDFFKAYNDQHGHQGGDRLLWLAANLWRDRLRDTDVLARWGGEEFGLLLPNCDAPSAERLIDRLRDLPLNGVTFSAGVAQWDGASAPEALTAAADDALYAAKRAGRNRTQLATVAEPA